MAVRLEGTTRRYIGLSTDEKPVPGYQLDGSRIAGQDLPAGSSFLERDTGRILRWDGESWTYPQPTDETQTEILQLLYVEMHALRELIERVVND